MGKLYLSLLVFASSAMLINNVSAQTYVEPKTGYYSGVSWSNDRTTVNSSWYSSTNCVNVGTDKKPVIQCADGGGTEVQNMDEQYVYCEFKTDETKFLSVKDFNFKFDNLPPGSTPNDVIIEAIEISFSRYVTSGAVLDKEIRLIKGGVVNYNGYNVGESNKAKPAISSNEWPAKETMVTYGGPTDPYPLWGTTWTLADIMDPGFGVALSARKLRGNNQVRAYIGLVALKVYYGAPIKPLPVELAKFTARYENGIVVLDWKTASEKDNDYFAIERSANGNDFEQIGRVKGAGSTQQSHSYNFTDEYALKGTAYYRLKQTDFDGTFSYSKIVSVSPPKTVQGVVLFPNPSDGQNINISTIIKIQDKATITIYNTAGEKLYQQEVKDIGGTPITLKPDRKLNSGLYLIHLENGKENIRQSFIVQ